MDNLTSSELSADLTNSELSSNLCEPTFPATNPSDVINNGDNTTSPVLPKKPIPKKELAKRTEFTDQSVDLVELFAKSPLLHHCAGSLTKLQEKSLQAGQHPTEYSGHNKPFQDPSNMVKKNQQTQGTERDKHFSDVIQELAKSPLLAKNTNLQTDPRGVNSVSNMQNTGLQVELQPPDSRSNVNSTEDCTKSIPENHLIKRTEQCGDSVTESPAVIEATSLLTKSQIVNSPANIQNTNLQAEIQYAACRGSSAKSHNDLTKPVPENKLTEKTKPNERCNDIIKRLSKIIGSKGLVREMKNTSSPSTIASSSLLPDIYILNSGGSSLQGKLQSENWPSGRESTSLPPNEESVKIERDAESTTVQAVQQTTPESIEVRCLSKEDQSEIRKTGKQIYMRVQSDNDPKHVKFQMEQMPTGMSRVSTQQKGLAGKAQNKTVILRRQSSQHAENATETTATATSSPPAVFRISTINNTVVVMSDKAQSSVSSPQKKRPHDGFIARCRRVPTPESSPLQACSTASTIHASQSIPTSPSGTSRNKPKEMKRPMNAFLIWARDMRPVLAQDLNTDNATVSKRLGEMWGEMSPEKQKPFFEKAEKLKAQQEKVNSDWAYRHQRPTKRTFPQTHNPGMCSLVGNNLTGLLHNTEKTKHSSILKASSSPVCIPPAPSTASNWITSSMSDIACQSGQVDVMLGLSEQCTGTPVSAQPMGNSQFSVMDTSGQHTAEPVVIQPAMNPQFSVQDTLGQYTVNPVNIQPAINTQFSVQDTSAHHALKPVNIQHAINPQFNIQDKPGHHTLKPVNIQPAINPQFNVHDTSGHHTVKPVNIQPAIIPQFNVLDTSGHHTLKPVNIQPAINPQFRVQDTSGHHTVKPVNIQPAINPQFNVLDTSGHHALKPVNIQPAINPQFSVLDTSGQQTMEQVSTQAALASRVYKAGPSGQHPLSPRSVQSSPYSVPFRKQSSLRVKMADGSTRTIPIKVSRSTTTSTAVYSTSTAKPVIASASIGPTCLLPTSMPNLIAKPIGYNLIRVTTASESTASSVQIKTTSHVDRSSTNTTRTLITLPTTLAPIPTLKHITDVSSTFTHPPQVRHLENSAKASSSASSPFQAAKKASVTSALKRTMPTPLQATGILDDRPHHCHFRFHETMPICSTQHNSAGLQSSQVKVTAEVNRKMELSKDAQGGSELLSMVVNRTPGQMLRTCEAKSRTGMGVTSVLLDLRKSAEDIAQYPPAEHRRNVIRAVYMSPTMKAECHQLVQLTASTPGPSPTPAPIILPPCLYQQPSIIPPITTTTSLVLAACQCPAGLGQCEQKQPPPQRKVYTCMASLLSDHTKLLQRQAPSSGVVSALPNDHSQVLFMPVSSVKKVDRQWWYLPFSPYPLSDLQAAQEANEAGLRFPLNVADDAMDDKEDTQPFGEETNLMNYCNPYNPAYYNSTPNHWSAVPDNTPPLILQRWVQYMNCSGISQRPPESNQLCSGEVSSSVPNQKSMPGQPSTLLEVTGGHPLQTSPYASPEHQQGLPGQHGSPVSLYTSYTKQDSAPSPITPNTSFRPCHHNTHISSQAILFSNQNHPTLLVEPSGLSQTNLLHTNHALNQSMADSEMMGSLPRPVFVPPHFHDDTAHIGQQPANNPTSMFPLAGIQQVFSDRSPQLPSAHSVYANQDPSCSPLQCQTHHCNLHSIDQENPLADNRTWPAGPFAQPLSPEQLGQLPAAQSIRVLQENKCSPLKCQPIFIPFHCSTLDGQSNEDPTLVQNESTIQGHQELLSEHLGQFASPHSAYTKQDSMYSPMPSQPGSVQVSDCLQTGQSATPLARHYLQTFSPYQLSAAQGIVQNPGSPGVQSCNNSSLVRVPLVTDVRPGCAYQVTQGITESAAAAASAAAAVQQPLSSQARGEGNASWPEGAAASEVVIVPASWTDGVTAPILVRDSELNPLSSSCLLPCKRKREH